MNYQTKKECVNIHTFPLLVAYIPTHPHQGNFLHTCLGACINRRATGKGRFFQLSNNTKVYYWVYVVKYPYI